MPKAGREQREAGIMARHVPFLKKKKKVNKKLKVKRKVGPGSQKGRAQGAEQTCHAWRIEVRPT